MLISNKFLERVYNAFTVPSKNSFQDSFFDFFDNTDIVVFPAELDFL